MAKSVFRKRRGGKSKKDGKKKKPQKRKLDAEDKFYKKLTKKERELAEVLEQDVLPTASVLSPFVGSEPLIITWDQARDMAERHELNLDVITNAQYLTEERFRELEPLVSAVTFSSAVARTLRALCSCAAVACAGPLRPTLTTGMWRLPLHAVHLMLPFVLHDGHFCSFLAPFTGNEPRPLHSPHGYQALPWQ